MTCACCVADLGAGESVLVTTLTGQVPKSAGRPLPAQGAGEPTGSGSAEISPGETATDRSRGTIRFVWQTDGQARFTHVSPGLAEAVGPEAADIVERKRGLPAAMALSVPGAPAWLRAAYVEDRGELSRETVGRIISHFDALNLRPQIEQRVQARYTTAL